MADTENLNPGKQDREDREHGMASLALAGLQRPAYAGVFRRVPKRQQATWICELPLDGYNRHITITICRRSIRTPAGGTQTRYHGRMTGLHPFFAQCDFDLTAPVGDAPERRLVGYLDLPGARLGVTVMPCRGADGDKLMIGLLEVQREPLAGDKQPSSPLGPG